MVATKQKKPDFREAAIAASEKLLAAHPGVDPLDAGVSYCIKASDTTAPPGTWPFLLAAAGGIGLIALGAVIALLGRDARTEAAEWRYLTVGGICTLSGFATIFGFMISQRKKALNHLSQRIGEFPKHAFTVNLTYGGNDGSPLKGAESAVVILYPDRQCVQIESLRYRYLVHGPDTQGVRLYGGGDMHSTATTFVFFRVGNVPLVLGLSSDRFWKMAFSSA